MIAIAFIGGAIRFGYWMGQVNTDRRNFAAFMQEIRGKLEQIFERLPSQPRTVDSFSPMQLTDFGKRVSAKFKAEEWAKTTVASTKLRQNSLGKEPFQIDATCQSYVRNRDDGHYWEWVDQCAYNFGIDRVAVLDVLRVVLRERIIKDLSNHFRRRNDEETWHTSPLCKLWPNENFIVSWTEPTVGLHCDQCKFLKAAEDQATKDSEESSDDDIPF